MSISLERYIAVCFPLKARIWINEETVKRLCLCIIVFILVLSIWSYFYETYFRSYGFDVYVAIVLHFFPFAVVLIFNVLIYLGVRFKLIIRFSSMF